MNTYIISLVIIVQYMILIIRIPFDKRSILQLLESHIQNSQYQVCRPWRTCVRMMGILSPSWPYLCVCLQPLVINSSQLFIILCVGLYVLVVHHLPHTRTTSVFTISGSCFCRALPCCYNYLKDIVGILMCLSMAVLWEWI